MRLQTLWHLLGWLAMVGYLWVAGTVLWNLWRPMRPVTPMSLYLLLCALAAHFLYLVEGVVTGWLRLDTPETVALVLGWFVALSAFAQWRWREMVAPAGFLLPLSAVLAAFALFEKPTSLSPALRRDVLMLHVTLMMSGYLALMLAFSTAVVHLLTLALLKRKRPLAVLKKLPPLETTERLTTQLVLVGFPLLVLGMLVGIVWARSEGRSAWSDPKVLFSLLTGGVFAAYLHARFVRHWKATALHWLVVVGFACLLVTFLVVRHTLALEG